MVLSPGRAHFQLDIRHERSFFSSSVLLLSTWRIEVPHQSEHIHPHPPVVVMSLRLEALTEMGVAVGVLGQVFFCVETRQWNSAYGFWWIRRSFWRLKG